MHEHIWQYKGLIHMVLFLMIIIKVYLIDKKLSLLEKTITHK